MVISTVGGAEARTSSRTLRMCPERYGWLCPWKRVTTRQPQICTGSEAWDFAHEKGMFDWDKWKDSKQIPWKRFRKLTLVWYFGLNGHLPFVASPRPKACKSGRCSFAKTFQRISGFAIHMPKCQWWKLYIDGTKDLCSRKPQLIR